MIAEGAAANVEIDAIVVTHDSGATLNACVTRLLAAQGVRQCVLVDNASRDDAPDSVQALLAPTERARVRVLRNTRNLGYAVACNQGARQGNSPWVAFVNPDCLVEADTFTRMRAASAPDVGLLGANVRDAHGGPEPAARRYAPTLSRVLMQVSGLARRWPQRGLYRVPDAEATTRATQVDACSGALMLLPRAVFEALGGFDEAYPLHGEDLDLCARVRAAGHRVLVANDAPVVHIKGTSSQARPLYVAWCKHRGLARYLHRHAAHGSAWRHGLISLGVWTRFALSLPWLCWRALRAPRPAS